MNDLMGRMDMVKSDMSWCADGHGNRADTAPFARMTQEMRSDRAQHRNAMRASGTLEASQTEELRHLEAMRDRLGALREQIGTMMGQGNAYRCGQCPRYGMVFSHFDAPIR